MGGLRAEGSDRLPRLNGPFVNLVTPNFFRVSGLGIRDGRGFTKWDRAGTQQVAVVNTTFARIVWPGREAVGRCLYVGRDSTDCTVVVGVAESALEFGLEDTDRIPHTYLPLEQRLEDHGTPERFRRQRTLVVRTQGDPGRIAPPVLAALADLFPNLPADRVRSLPAVFAPRIRTWTIGTGLFGAAALLAVAHAALGLYAEIAFGELNDVAGLSDHPALRRVRVDSPTGPVEMPAPPARIDGGGREPGPIPAAGAHSEALRKEFAA